jgi:hypothetical protein
MLQRELIVAFGVPSHPNTETFEKEFMIGKRDRLFFGDFRLNFRFQLANGFQSFGGICLLDLCFKLLILLLLIRDSFLQLVNFNLLIFCFPIKNFGILSAE